MEKAQTSLTKQYPDETYIPKVEIVSIAKTGIRNFVVKVLVLNGIVNKGDIIKLKLPNNTKTQFIVNNVYVNSQQTTMGLAGETAELITHKLDPRIFSAMKEKYNTPKLTGIAFSKEIVELASIGLARALYENNKIDRDRYEFLLECPILRHKIMNYNKFLEAEDNTGEGLISKLKNFGLKSLTNKEGKLDLKKGIGVATVLGIFGFAVYNKLAKTCLPKMGKARLLCKKQAVDKVIAELSKQAAMCNTLTDPIQKRKCLKNVESKKQKWIIKSSALGQELAKYKE